MRSLSARLSRREKSHGTVLQIDLSSGLSCFFDWVAYDQLYRLSPCCEAYVEDQACEGCGLLVNVAHPTLHDPQDAAVWFEGLTGDRLRDHLLFLSFRDLLTSLSEAMPLLARPHEIDAICERFGGELL